MDKNERKQLIAAYKEKGTRSGVYRICNVKTGWFTVSYSFDLDGIKNRYAFGAKTGGIALLPPHIQKAFEGFGWEAFKLEELDVLKVKPESTREEVRQDLAELAELWKEKLGQK